MTTIKTGRPADLGVYQTHAGVLIEHIREIAEKVGAVGIFMLLEKSQKYDPLAKAFIANARFTGITPSGEAVPLPVVVSRMDKRHAFPGLEVADFVMNAAGGHARGILTGREAYELRDFRAVFRDVPESHVKFWLLSDVAKNLST